jgi:hypothetical protein
MSRKKMEKVFKISFWCVKIRKNQEERHETKTIGES